MSYEAVVEEYIQHPQCLRTLMMKLPIDKSFAVLVSKLHIVPATRPVSELFGRMRGEWVITCGRGNRVYDEKIHNHAQCRDAAVLLAIRALSGHFTRDDNKVVYNAYKFVQTHSRIFGDRVRFHVRAMVEPTLTRKQQQREQRFPLTLPYDKEEGDTSESEDEYACIYCEKQVYMCDCRNQYG